MSFDQTTLNKAETTDRKNLALELEKSQDAVWSGGKALSKLEEWVVKNATWLAIGVIAAAFAVRVAYSASCYLNPDEAQHFDAARPDTWLGVFRASHRLAHPPLFIFVLHAILYLGRTEVILRLPSIAGGTAALWLTFAWIRRTLGGIPALAGLLFMAISPAAISASTEVRQYGLLLFFICGSVYATERALSDRSTNWAIIQGLFLLGALLTHYTSSVVILSLDIYVLIRYIAGDIPRRVLFTFICAQLVLAAVLGWLYLSYIRHADVFIPSNLLYLKSFYYVPSSERLLDFSRRAFVATFSYLVSQKRAIFSMLAFLAGVAALMTGRTKAPRLMSLLILTPFVVGFATALFQVLPFAGSRHQTYLLPFLAAGFSAALAWIPRKLAVPLLLAGAVYAPFWILRTPPDNNRRTVPIGDMTAAINYIDRVVPGNAPLFMDDKTHYILKYYLGGRDPNLDSWQHRNDEKLDGHLVIAPRAFGWVFSPKDVLTKVNESAKDLGVPRGEPLWIISVAWLDQESLASELPAGAYRSANEFGVISVIETERD
jgi:Dolichyl-phosphate-mannose-protein mannosyltransferase